MQFCIYFSVRCLLILHSSSFFFELFKIPFRGLCLNAPVRVAKVNIVVLYTMTIPYLTLPIPKYISNLDGILTVYHWCIFEAEMQTQLLCSDIMCVVKRAFSSQLRILAASCFECVWGIKSRLHEGKCRKLESGGGSGGSESSGVEGLNKNKYLLCHDRLSPISLPNASHQPFKWFLWMLTYRN